MALTYRSNRFVNFAQGDLGTVPVVLMVMLMSAWGWSYGLAPGAGIVGAIVLGAVVELAIIRRFFKSPRLLLTVASLGLSQLLAASALLMPKLWGATFPLLGKRLDPPFDAELSIGTVVFNANDMIAVVVAPIALIALALFLRRSNFGVAIRASADSADRAALLGVPVKRLQTVVWSISAVLAFIAIFLRAGIVGLPIASALSVGVLLRALGALVLGRMTNLPAIAANAVALGVLEVGELHRRQPAVSRPDPRGDHRRGVVPQPSRRGASRGRLGVDVAVGRRRAADSTGARPAPDRAAGAIAWGARCRSLLACCRRCCRSIDR